MKNREKQGSVAKSAGVVSLGTFLSRLLGLVREQVTAYLFGAGDYVDAFKSAFRIPNLLRDMFAEGALSAGFVPLFSEKMKINGREDAIRFAGLVFGALTAIVALVVLIMIIFTPQIAQIIVGGFMKVPGKMENTIVMARMMMPFLLLISLSALMMGILNSLGRFAIPALAPAILNIGMILSAVALSKYLDPPILSLAIGVLIGGIGQFVLQYAALRRIGFRFSLIFDLVDPDLRRLFLLMIPMTIGLAANQINVAVITRIASNETGAVSYLDYAFRVLHLPLGLFAIAIATVSLPRLAAEAASGEYKKFSLIHSEALRLGCFFSIPATIIMILLSEEICSVIYQYGQFNYQDTLQTARTLSLYVLGLPFFTLTRITVPAFYAQRDTRTPAMISIGSVIINIFLCYQLRPYLGFTGLALAAAIAGSLNWLALTLLLRRRIEIREDYNTMLTVGKIITATLISGLALYFMKNAIYKYWLTTGEHKFLALLILLLFTTILYIGCCYLLKVSEIKRFIETIRSKLIP